MSERHSLTIRPLRIVRGILNIMAGLAIILILFTAMQFNMQGAGMMALLAALFLAGARAIGWLMDRTAGPNNWSP